MRLHLPHFSAVGDAAASLWTPAECGLLPQRGLSAGVARNRYAADDSSSQEPGDADARLSGTRRSYGADLRQTPWDLEAPQRLRRTDAQVAQAQAEYLEARQSLILRVADAYFDVLAAADAPAANRAERAACPTPVERATCRGSTRETGSTT